MKKPHFKFVVLDRFLVSTVQMFGVDKAMDNWSRCEKTERPAEVPVASVRDGHYRLKVDKSEAKHFTCVQGQWFIDGTCDTDFEQAPLHPGDKVLAELANVPRKYLSKEGLHILDYWEFQTMLRKTSQRAKIASLRILGKRKKKKRVSKVVK